MKKIKLAEKELEVLLKIVKEKQDFLFCLKAERVKNG